MDYNAASQSFLETHRALPASQVVGLVGSHRGVAWPPLCAACGSPATSRLDVAKIFGRHSRHGTHAYYRFIVRMPIPFCGACTARHRQLVAPVPSIVGSFVRTPALLSFIGAAAVAGILTTIVMQGGDAISPGWQRYAIGGIALILGLGTFLTARDARFLRVPPLTEVTGAADFSDNVGFPYGRRRLYALRHPAFAAAFRAANQDRAWTEAIQTRDAWIGGIVFVVLIVATVIAMLVRG